MRTLLVLAALAALALCDEPLPTYCDNYPSGYWYTLTRDVSWNSYADYTYDDLCVKMEVDPGTKSYDFVALRRRTRFNESGSYLYFCVDGDVSKIEDCSFSLYSSYAWSFDWQGTAYGHIKLNYGLLESHNPVYFEMRQYRGSSHTDWKNYCSDANCDSEGACLANGTCWCDEGHIGCDALGGLAAWLAAVIVIIVVVAILLPVIIIICCCCCVGCCAAAAAAAH